MTGQKENGPHSRELPASGPFSQVMAGVGVRTSVGRADGFTARRSYPTSMPLTSTYAVRGGIPGQARPLTCIAAVFASGSAMGHLPFWGVLHCAPLP